MNIEKKKQLVEKLEERLEKAQSALFVDYSGLGAGPLDNLRGRLLDEEGSFQVVKNTLLARAIEGLKIKEGNLEELLEGPTALVLSFNDALKSIKIVSEYKEEVGGLDFKGGIFEGVLISGNEAQELAEIPGRGALLSQFAMLAQAPLQRLIATANAPLQRLNSDLKTLSKRE